MSRAPERQLPNSIEAEQAVLGSILIDPEALVEVADLLRAEDFYRDAHCTIYETILSLSARREEADYLTVCDALERRNKLEDIGGASYLTSLIDRKSVV